MIKFRPNRLILVGVLLVLILWSACEPPAKTGYPHRPVTLIVPAEAGNSVDKASRALASVLEEELDQPIHVINRTGGRGIVGHAALKQAKPDGYTLGIITAGITMMHWTGLTPLTFADYTPLALVTVKPCAITVHSETPWSTILELIGTIKEAPGTITASGSAHGGIADLCRIGFLQIAGLEESAMPWIPSHGADSALQALLSGRVDVVTATLSEDINALRKAGHVRTLAVMADQRLPMAPNVHTHKELGMDHVSVGDWMVIVAPMGLADGQIQRLRTATRRALFRKVFRDSLEQSGYQLQYLTGNPLDRFLEAQDQQNGLLMHRGGLVSQ